MFTRRSVCITASLFLLLAAVSRSAMPAQAATEGSFSSALDRDAGVSNTNDDLFSKPLFSDDSMGQQLDDDIDKLQTTTQPKHQRVSVDQKIARAQLDGAMRSQMRAVANYLYRYCLRNGSRFPGNNDDEMYAAQVQCTERVPNNPYNYGATETMNWGIPAQYNANGSAATGSPVWNDQWTQHLQAQQNGRVLLSMDYSLTPEIVNQWADNPPASWHQAPGTISAIGNNQGLFIVWGADANGNPIKNPLNGKTLIIAVSTSGTTNDQIAPNGT